MKLAKSIAGCLLAGAVALLSAPVSVGATLTAITDRAAWDALVSNTTLIDFDTPVAANGYLPPATNDWYMVPSYPLTISGVTFTSFTDAQPQHLYLNNYNVNNSGTVLKSESYRMNQRNYIHIAMPAGGVTAWGFDLTVGGAYATYVINVGPDSLAVNTTSPRSFYGFTSSTPVTSVDIDFYGSNAVVDNLVFGSAGSQNPPPDPAQTPEITTMLLCGTGLWSMAKFARRTARS